MPPFSAFYVRFNDEVGNSSRVKETDYQEIGYQVGVISFPGNQQI